MKDEKDYSMRHDCGVALDILYLMNDLNLPSDVRNSICDISNKLLGHMRDGYSLCLRRKLGNEFSFSYSAPLRPDFIGFLGDDT